MPDVAPSSERTRIILLLVILVIVAGVALVKNLNRERGHEERRLDAVLTYTPRPLPQLEAELHLAALNDSDSFERNPFVYGAPPTPTRNLTPPPTRRPPPPRTPRPTPSPRFVLGADGTRLPPPPSFSRDYIGYLGPDRLHVAVFRQGETIEVAASGETLDDVFIIRQIGLESVEIGFVGYPEKESTRVPLAAN